MNNIQFRNTGSFARVFIIPILILLGGCKKLVQIPEPINTITSAEVFSSDGTATQAILSIYNKFTSNFGSLAFASGSITLYCGLSADELNYFLVNAPITQFQNNALTSDNVLISSQIWNSAYLSIYQCNSAVEGLQASASVSDSVRKELIAEAKFLRAFDYFYLTNLFGDVPLPLTSDWNQTYLIPKTSQAVIYKQIIQDLKDAQAGLPIGYSAYGGYRDRATQAAAIALLARVYLCTSDWVNAETASSNVIANATYSLVSNPNNVFLKNSLEAILQFATDSAHYPALAEPAAIIPLQPTTGRPSYFITTQLMNDFELNDLRKSAWTNATKYTVGGTTTTYYYPYKYKIGVGTLNNAPEFYMAIRLAEMYLIRAEARGQLNSNLSGAIDDLNTIRQRATLLPLSNTLTQVQVLAAVAQERRIELFSEWGHRWFDLKRTNQASSILNQLKSGWTNNAQLYPIPLAEIRANPNLVQNTGY